VPKHYQYQGKHYELPDGLSNEEALAKIKNHLGESSPDVAGAAALSKVGGISSAPWYARPTMGSGPSVLQATEALPAIGGAIGGLLGSRTVVPSVAVAGAGLGGGFGRSLRDLIRRAIGASAPETSSEALREILKSAAKEAAAEGVGLGLMRGARAISSPGTAGVEASVQAAARRQGVEMPASAISSSRPVAYAETVAAEGFGGSAVAKRFTTAQQKLTALADETVSGASTLQTGVQRGEAISKGLAKFKDQWIQTKNSLYKEVDEELPGLVMEAPGTVRLLDDVVSKQQGAARILKGGPAKSKNVFEGLVEGLTEWGPDGRRLKQVQIKDLREAIRELDNMGAASHADPFAAKHKGLISKLSATLDDDLERALARESPEAAAKLHAANRAYAEGIGKINSVFGKAIHKFAQDERYDLIAKTVANPRMSVSDVPRIMEVAGKEGTEALRASVAADLVGRGKNAEGLLTPQGLSKAMKAYGEDRLEAILTKAQYSKLKDLATLTGSLERGQKIMHGSPTAGKARWMAYGSALTGAAVGHPMALAYIVGDVAFNKFIGTKIGQRWLTTGFPKAGATMGGLLRQAPRAGVAGIDMQNVEE